MNRSNPPRGFLSCRHEMLSSKSDGSYGEGGGGGRHPDPEIRGWPGLKIFFFDPSGLSLV